MSTFKEIIQGDVPVLVDFHATWCGPCKTMSPIVESLGKKYQGKVRILKVDVDKNQAAATKYKVRGVPTFLLFKKGEILWRQSGAIPENQLDQILTSHI